MPTASSLQGKRVYPWLRVTQQCRQDLNPILWTPHFCGLPASPHCPSLSGTPVPLSGPSGLILINVYICHLYQLESNWGQGLHFACLLCMLMSSWYHVCKGEVDLGSDRHGHPFPRWCTCGLRNIIYSPIPSIHRYLLSAHCVSGSVLNASHNDFLMTADTTLPTKRI